jgi:hypothetical protein
MSSCNKLNKELLAEVKKAFVPMPGGQAEPVAGAGQMTAGLAGPMGGDPAAAGGAMPPGGDPATMGGMPPMDPSMLGMDPSMMGGMPPAGSISMSVPEFIELIYAIRGEGGASTAQVGEEGKPAESEKKPAPGGKADISVKLDQILQAVQGGGGVMSMDPMGGGAGAGMPTM